MPQTGIKPYDEDRDEEILNGGTDYWQPDDDEEEGEDDGDDWDIEMV